MRGGSRWRLAWPGIAGCVVLALDTAALLLFERRPYIGMTWGMAIGPGLLLCALFCVVVAVSEPPRTRRPALLMNGVFLLAVIAYVWLLFAPSVTSGPA
jgi:predicted nucleic acid-binding Zn ribbon protein